MLPYGVTFLINRSIRLRGDVILQDLERKTARSSFSRLLAEIEAKFALCASIARSISRDVISRCMSLLYQIEIEINSRSVSCVDFWIALPQFSQQISELASMMPPYLDATSVTPSG
jgi:hypothetical protein